MSTYKVIMNSVISKVPIRERMYFCRRNDVTGTSDKFCVIYWQWFFSLCRKPILHWNWQPLNGVVISNSACPYPKGSGPKLAAIFRELVHIDSILCSHSQYLDDEPAKIFASCHMNAQSLQGTIGTIVLTQSMNQWWCIIIRRRMNESIMMMVPTMIAWTEEYLFQKVIRIVVGY